MLNLSGEIRVFVCTQPADMRRSFDGLCGMVESIVQQEPLSGHLFVLRNRNRDRLKILYWDRDGLAIWYKKLEGEVARRSVCTESGSRSHNQCFRPAGTHALAGEVRSLSRAGRS